MCGIFGYIGKRTAEPLLVEGLRTLEYRGYDSAGIYVPGYGSVKAVGPIDNLAKKIISTIPGTVGIAHTRWATHGAPTEKNAHPHCDSLSSIWLVHNGIIENYQSLKSQLGSEVAFTSDTDTEVLAKLIGHFYRGNLLEAVQKVLKEVVGTYGLVVVSADNPEEMVVAKLGSPIVLGVSDHGHFVSSDPSALLAHTKDVVYLEDGEIAVVTSGGYEVVTHAGERKQKDTEKIEWDVESVQKQGYEHFMQKEIFEAPEVIENSIRGRLMSGVGKAKLGGLEKHLDQLVNLDRLTITACGSAYYAGYVGKYMLEEYAGLPVDLELASEYRYKRPMTTGKSALLAITQSGETADTLAAVKMANELGLLTLGVVNVVGSTIARETKAGVYNHAGPEVAVASTKAFISQLTVLALLALLIGRERGVSKAEGQKLAEALVQLPETLRTILKQSDQIKQVAERYAGYRNAMFIGRKFSAPIGFEGALKLKEVSYLHAEAYAGGELKHGPIAMLDKDFPVIALVPQDDVYEKMISNIEEVKARRAPVLAFASVGDDKVFNLADDVVYLPKVHPLLNPIVYTVPLHLLAYYIGVAKGLNVDRPRNLAKSVTVE